MKTKKLINKTFDKVIEKLKKEKSTEQVLDDESIEKTDKNITKICKDEISKPKGL